MRKLQHENREKSWPLSSVVSLSEEIDIAWKEGKKYNCMSCTHTNTQYAPVPGLTTHAFVRVFSTLSMLTRWMYVVVSNVMFSVRTTYTMLFCNNPYLPTERMRGRSEKKNCLRQCLIIIAVCVRDYHIAHNAHWTQMAVKWIFSKSRSGMLHNSTEYLSSRLSPSRLRWAAEFPSEISEIIVLDLLLGVVDYVS